MTPKYGRAPNKTQGAVVIFPTTSWIQNGAGSSTLQDTFAEETAFWKTDRTYPVITVLNLHGTRNVKQNTICLLKPALNQPTAPEFRGPKNTFFSGGKRPTGFLCFKGGGMSFAMMDENPC